MAQRKKHNYENNPTANHCISCGRGIHWSKGWYNKSWLKLIWFRHVISGALKTHREPICSWCSIVESNSNCLWVILPTWKSSIGYMIFSGGMLEERPEVNLLESPTRHPFIWMHTEPRHEHQRHHIHHDFDGNQRDHDTLDSKQICMKRLGGEQFHRRSTTKPPQQ